MAKNIEVKILGDAKPLQRSLNGASRNVKEFEGHLGKASRGAASASGAFSHLGRSIAFASGAFLGAAGFTTVVKGSVEAAMSLEKEMAKTRAVFGSNSKAVETWSKTTAHAFGISSAEALKSANQFGQMLKVMGVGKGVALDMSKSLTELSAKLALFAGKTQEEAAAALAGGLTGRTRALKAYGIVIDQTTIKAEAMRLGMVKSAVSSRAVEEAQTRLAIASAKAAEAHKKYGENTTQVASADLAVKKAHDALAKATAGVTGSLSAAQKAQATYSLIQGQSKAASETWRREQGSAEVQMKKLKAEIHDTEVTIGNALLPTVLKITTKMADWLGSTEHQKKIQEDLNKTVDTATALLGGLKDAIQLLAVPAKALNNALGGTKHSFELLFALGIVGKLRAMSVALGLVKTEAAGAALATGTGKLGLLSNLRALAKIGAITIAIDVFLHLHHGKGSWLSKSARSMFGGGSHHLGLLGDWLFGSGNANQFGASGNTGPSRQMGGPKGAPTVTGGTAIQRGLVSTAQGSLGVPYQYGGAPSLSKPTDCSGLMVAVFRKNGISLPRTSQAQFSSAPIKNAKPLLPGDLVFAEGIHPGHVGLYIGKGMVLEDPHTGDHVKIVPLSAFGWNGMSARWWGGNAKISGGGAKGGATAASASTGGDTGGATGALTVGTSKATAPVWKGATVATIISAKASVTARLTEANKVIGGMAGPMDAIEKAAEDHLKKLKAHLHPHMTPADLARTKAEIAKWGKVLSDEIAAQTKAAQRAFDAASKKMFRAFDEATADHERKFNRETEDHLRQMAADFTKVMAAFDKETARGLAARAAPALTPTEALLQARAAARANADLQKALSDALASGDPQAIADAQYDIETAALERQAAAERAAADAKADADQSAYSDQRQALAESLTEQERLREQDYQDGRDADLRHWEDMRDDQRDALQQQLDDWNEMLTNKKKSWNDFWKWIKDNPEGGPITTGSATNGKATPRPGRVFEPRASGGSVVSGSRYLVGERGPEMFSPSRSGFIIPAGQGGGDTYNFTFPNYVGSKNELVDTVTRELYRIQKRNTTLGFT